MNSLKGEVRVVWNCDVRGALALPELCSSRPGPWPAKRSAAAQCLIGSRLCAAAGGVSEKTPPSRPVTGR